MDSSDAEVVAVVLDALHKFTPPQLKKEVFYLAKGHGAARKHPEIQQSAAELLQKLNTPKDENILLRSGSRPIDEALLRPAQDNSTTSPHELLRSTLSKNGRE